MNDKTFPVPAGFVLFPTSARSDVLTAAGLVRHGKQCKELADRLGEAVAASWGVGASPSPAVVDEPIDMVLHCPECGMQHIDRRDEPLSADWDDAEAWTNPPHRSHLCHGCSHIWRPADVPTNGVKAVQTKGKADSPIRSRAVLAGDGMLEPLIYAAIMHHGTPKTVAEFERAAANVADMLQRRQAGGELPAPTAKGLRFYRESK